MYRSTLAHIAMFASLLSMSACSNIDGDLSARQSAVQYAQASECVTLYAGQTINAGTACVSVEGQDLLVTYNTVGGWQMTEVHAWVGDSLATMPQTKTGNPQIGRFPYTSGDITGATTYTFRIPLTSLSTDPELCGHTFLVATHAALRKADGSGGYETQTGWGAGDQINTRGSWATYFSYKVVCDVTPPPPPPELQCDTAFAFGEQTFISLGLTQSRWGWEVGPLAPGSYSRPIYAGAAQNDTSKGALVGQLGIAYDGANVNVSYQLDAGYVLQGTHLYVGTSNVSTISPGQFGNTHDLNNVSSDSFSVGGFSGQSIYVVAHAVSCH